MKWSLLLLAACFFWAGCDDEDHSFLPDETVVQAFNEKYPTATRVEWERKNNYSRAEFTYNNQHAQAWFDQSGQWYLTKTELDNLTRLPEAVQEAFRNSKYASWRTDDIDLLERKEMEPMYVIEVENGNQEYDLYYSETGILIKAVADTDNDDDYESSLPGVNLLTPAMQEFIETNYSGARIIDTEQEKGNIEVDIIHQNRSKEVVFSAQGEWLNTHYDVAPSEVEEVVRQTIATNYPGYTTDDCEKYELPGNSIYYLFELEKGNTEIYVRVDSKGNILSNV